MQGNRDDRDGGAKSTLVYLIVDMRSGPMGVLIFFASNDQFSEQFDENC